MRERTRQSFEMAHYHNLYKSGQGITGQELISCMAETIRQHAYTWNVFRSEMFSDKSDIELIVEAFVAYRDGALVLCTKEEQDIPLDGLFNLVAKKLKEEGTH